ncbi:MAG: glycosyltransferase family 4 protein [Syntrophales bacterium]
MTLKFFYYAYWHDRRFKNLAGGPIKVYELTDNLVKLGHDVTLFIPDIGSPQVQTSAKVVALPFIDVHILRFISFQFLSFLYSLRLILKSGRPDTIYVRIMWSFMPMLIGKLFSIPVILEVNDSPTIAYSNVKSTIKRAIAHLSDKISYRLSDHILPVTEKIAENLYLRERVPWSSMTVMPSGTNTDVFQPMDRNECAVKLNLPADKKYIGFVGTFFSHQGIDILIESAPFIIQEYPDVRFLLVGDGPMKTEWEKMIHKKGLVDYFIMTGNVPYADVPFYCGVMDICVAPFLRGTDERSPVKIFDYLACGKPVIVSETGETSGFFKESGAVITFPAEDHVSLYRAARYLLENEPLRNEMGARGREFISSKYSRKKITETVEEIALHLYEKYRTR